MAQFQNVDLYMVVDDYEFDDGEDGLFSDYETQKACKNGDDSDFEDDLDMIKPKTDTSAFEARNGKDIQGIPWERLNYSRDKYREMRLKQYKNFESLSHSRVDLEKECKNVEKGSMFYDFQYNSRLVKSTIVHFQPLSRVGGFVSGWSIKDTLSIWHMLASFYLHVIASSAIPDVLRGFAELRNLLWATSKNDVYLVENYSVMHWSSLLHRGTEVLNVAKPIVPSTNYSGTLAQTLSRVQVSTMAVKDNLLVAGGFHGELICKYLNRPGDKFCTKLTTNENAITNTVDLFQNPSGSTRVITGNNDAQVRVFDSEKFACVNCFSFDWSVNNTTISPDGKLLAVLGDSTECLIADAQSGKVVGNLKGHLDYSFSSAWHPSGQILATGNQDTTCRLWDIRNLSQSLDVLKGRMGAIRALKFNTDGRFLAMAEPADFVHIINMQSGYVREQEIDLFGEIAGVAFSPDDEALFIGVADRTYGSLLEFTRSHDRYTNSIY